MKIWNDDEVKELFQSVENCKKNGSSLREAFSEHAKKYGRKTNSVRNYYYADVDNLQKDSLRAQRLGVKIELHEKTHFSAFDKQQEEELFEQVKNLVDQGLSVRAACQKLSGGNLTTMTRLQNKFQNMQRKLKSTENVIPFKQKSLTDAEINSLFLGLVKLIKKNALEQNMPISSKSLRQELERKQEECVQNQEKIMILKRENEVLKVKNKVFEEKIKDLQQFLQNSGEKNENLRKHIASAREEKTVKINS